MSTRLVSMAFPSVSLTRAESSRAGSVETFDKCEFFLYESRMESARYSDCVRSPFVLASNRFCVAENTQPFDLSILFLPSVS